MDVINYINYKQNYKLRLVEWMILYPNTQSTTKNQNVNAPLKILK